MRSLFLMVVVVLLFGCNPKIKKEVHSLSGPINVCPGDNQLSYFRKSRKALDTYQACYDGDVPQLLASNRLFSYVRWLTLNKNMVEAEKTLLIAAEISEEPQEYYIELAKLEGNQGNWFDAQSYIEMADVSDDNPLKLRILARTGGYSTDFDQSLLPYIFQPNKSKTPNRATIKSDPNFGFSMTRVDNATPGVLAGETSIVASEDGQDVWVVWTDSSGSASPSTETNTWRLRAAQSDDGGLTWNNDDFSTNPQLAQVFHFDPMTAYDKNNELMYAGGLTVDYDNSNSDLNSIYLYRQDLTTHETEIVPQQYDSRFVDKAWMTTDEEGRLYMVEGVGVNKVRYSDDFGATFSEAFFDFVAGFIAPFPKVDREGCLHVIDHISFVRCDGNGGFEQVVAPNTSLDIHIMGSFLPGKFRSVPLRLIGFHPDDGRLIVIYPDLESAQSDDIALWMTQSVDGVTWDTPWIISPDVPGDRFLPWMQIDSEGRIHISYADTRTKEQADNDPDAFIDMYYSYSDDLGQSWTETRVTPTPLKVPSLDIWGSYFFSDYLEMAVAETGDVFMAFPWFSGTGDMDMYVAKKQNIGVSEFEINQGASGAWYYPETSGSGFFIDLRPADQFMFAAWFTHDVSNEDRPGNDTGARWYTASGSYIGNTAELELHETTGGIFDNSQAVATSRVGKVTFTFSDCKNGMVNYEFFDDSDMQGNFPIERAIPGVEKLCESLVSSVEIEPLELNKKITKSTDFEFNQGLSAAWYYPETSGSGFLLDIRPDDQFVFVGWFTHDVTNPNRPSNDTGTRWFTASGSYVADTVELELYETSDGLFDDSQAVTTTGVGTVTITFSDCKNGMVSYEFTDGSALQGSFPIERAVPGTESLCESLIGLEIQ